MNLGSYIDELKASLVESALAQNIDNEATQKAILKNLKLTQANSVLIASDKECTEADLRRVLTEANIIGVEQRKNCNGNRCGNCTDRRDYIH